MAVTDFDKIKKLDVASVSGTPTISKAVPIKITSGDDSTTGTGEIVLDWSNISDESDIAVYDENDNLLDYYFESFDATSEIAVIWVHRDWVRDGSTQAQIGYGNGDSDQSVSASTVFGKESDLSARYLFNESSGDLIDVSGNGNDGTVNGATQGESGIVGGAYSFDGTDDYVDTGLQQNTDNPFSVFLWFKFDVVVGSLFGQNPMYDKDRLFIGVYDGYARTAVGDTYRRRDSGFQPNTDTWYRVVLTSDGSTAKHYIDGDLVDSYSYSAGTNRENLYIGAYMRDGSGSSFSDSNIDDTYLKTTVVNSDYISADYDSTKSSPEFFSQQSAEETTVNNYALFAFGGI